MSTFRMLNRLLDEPYGVWGCADGRQVMFDRRYHPMWQRSAAGVVTPADPTEWVRFTTQRWLYGPETELRDRPGVIADAKAVWGLS
jgi:hypothetical protein